MTARLISETAFMELKDYEDGLPSWHQYPPRVTLLDHGYLKNVGGGFYQITEDGREVLSTFRERHGVRA